MGKALEPLRAQRETPLSTMAEGNLPPATLMRIVRELKGLASSPPDGVTLVPHETMGEVIVDVAGPGTNRARHHADTPFTQHRRAFFCVCRGHPILWGFIPGETGAGK